MRTPIVLVGLTVVANAAVAQQAKDTTTLNPIVITATRVPVDQSVAPTAVTVIRGEDLRARGVMMVSDALASVPGLTLVRSGSFGATTSLFARGGESDYVKVLIDGVPVNNPGGAFDFASLTTDNLDRIEVVRGPASVAYGSDAVAGVIQLFTRRGTGPVRGFADIRGGTFGTVEGEGGVAGGNSLVGYSLGASTRQTDGFLPFNNDFRNQVASGRLTFTPASSAIDLTGRWNAATYHFPTDGSGAVVDSNSVRDDHRTVLGLDASHHLTSRVDLRLVGAASRLDGASSNAPDSPGDSTAFTETTTRASSGAAQTCARMCAPAATRRSPSARISSENRCGAAARVSSGRSRRARRRSPSTVRTRQCTPRRSVRRPDSRTR